MRTILVVDDEPLVLALIARVLIGAGFQVITASEPAQALATCQDREIRIDLMLTDLMMPGMNGRELRDRVVEIRPDLPVTYMSGYADSWACQLMGPDAADVLLKPFGIASLLTTVKNVVDHETLAGELDGMKSPAA